MPIDVETFREETHPPNLVRLMEEKVVQTLLNGFSYQLKAGVSVVYAKALPPSKETLRHLDVINDPELALQVAHPFCRKYRSVDTVHDDLCIDWDADLVLRYFNGAWSEPKLYRCHMDLWDMTYPLRVNGNLLGVLFAGQIIVADAVSSWEEALADVRQHVDWDSVRSKAACQTDDICRAISNGGKTLTQYREDLKKEAKKDNVPFTELISRFRDFLEFGRMMESLLGELYRLRVTAAEQRLLQEMAGELTRHTTTRDAWWRALALAAAKFQEATGVGPVEVYYHQTTGYIQRVGPEGVVAPDAAMSLPVHLCLRFPSDRLIEIAELGGVGPLPDHFSGNRDTCLYKCDLSVLEDRTISMVFFIYGAAQAPEKRRCAEDFCRVMGLRADISEVLFQINEDREAFAKRVRNVSHSTKTPLQIAMSELRRAGECLQAPLRIDEARVHIEGAKRSVLDSRAEISEIYPGLASARRIIDLGRTLKGLSREMQPLADDRRCRITVKVPDAPPKVRVCEPEIRLALRNLLDNAIKYSFDDHEIRIRASVIGGHTVEVIFDNYGIGIPKDRLENIRREGVRGGVPDPRKPGDYRAGTGLGIPIAIEYLQSHGGSLDIESRPADPYERSEYHRFSTIVTVTLPVVVRRRDHSE